MRSRNKRVFQGDLTDSRLTCSKKRAQWKAFLMFWASQWAVRPEDWYPEDRSRMSTNPFTSFTISSNPTSGKFQPILLRPERWFLSLCPACFSPSVSSSVVGRWRSIRDPDNQSSLKKIPIDCPDFPAKNRRTSQNYLHSAEKLVFLVEENVFRHFPGK